jgi:hypothetical protein
MQFACYFVTLGGRLPEWSGLRKGGPSFLCRVVKKKDEAVFNRPTLEA